MTTRTGEPKGPPAGSRASKREQPVRSPEFAHLTLPALRAYRQALTGEENKVSYWRRLIQARMDLLEMTGMDDTVRLARLRTALSEQRVGIGRQALVEIVPIEDAPPLPDLADLWAREVGEDDRTMGAELRKELAFAELQLSAYRAALHRRLSKATGELIARYHEDPPLALIALPLTPADRAALG
ncbi:MAG TPA: hypothetical protein VMW94_00230 [Actinomycetes bacterium]|nr:hypothetical protein [Actinomycetes bacterium]